MKLPEEFKQKFVAALRSGEYVQCRNMMFDGQGGHCCLGVAAVLSGVPYNELVDSEGIEAYNKLPEAINNGFDNPTAIHLIRMNDIEQNSFLEIADYIEQNL